MIVKLIANRRPVFLLFDHAGKRILGKHGSLELAQRQERAIAIAKARRAGHKIPRIA